MRVRREAKILKNHYREMTWETIVSDDDEFDYPVSRYKPNRVWNARCRLIKARRRRFRNNAIKAKTKGEIGYYRYCNHMASQPDYMLEESAYGWWNIKR